MAKYDKEELEKKTKMLKSDELISKLMEACREGWPVPMEQCQAELLRRLTPTGDAGELIVRAVGAASKRQINTKRLKNQALIAVAALQDSESDAIRLLKLMKDMHTKHKDILPNIGKVDEFLSAVKAREALEERT